jgi:hypothetical protein
MTSSGTREGSTQHRANVSRTSPSGPSVLARRRTKASPTPGTKYAEKASVTWRSRGSFGASGSAGSRSTRPATISGFATVSRIETSPPIELPTRIAGVPMTSTRNRSSQRALAWTLGDRPFGGV